MEDGQKISINLEAPLDTKSSDMLVSVNDVRFAHNRQKFQGHVLPTSLRYERDGWAAGWYVYDFKIGGGYIFSTNDNTLNGRKTWLAVNRSKINVTPTYVLSFHTAQNDDDSDTPDDRETLKQYADAVNNTVQFQAWFTDAYSISAPECQEIEIDKQPIPTITVGYYPEKSWPMRNRIQFTPFKNVEGQGIVFDPEDCFTTLSPNSQYDDDLTMEFVDRAADGTVTALLSNNVIKWEWQGTVYKPKDFVDSDGNVYAKFVSVSNGTNKITWNLNGKDLQYDDTLSKYTYDGVTYNPNTNVTFAYSIPVTYTIPISKYYSAFNNISWSVQGTRNLFNNESTDNPINHYKISYTQQQNKNIHNLAIEETGFDGPDVSLVSEMKIDLADILDTDRDNVLVGEDEILLYKEDNTDVPILTSYVNAFKLPGSDETHDVVVQVYFRFAKKGIHLNIAEEADNFTMYPIGYRKGSLWPKNTEPYYIDANSTNIHVNIDTVDFYNADAGIARKKIVGRSMNCKLAISDINGAKYQDPLVLNLHGINTTLGISKYLPPEHWDITMSRVDGMPGETVLYYPVFRKSIYNGLTDNSGAAAVEYLMNQVPAIFRDGTSSRLEYDYDADTLKLVEWRMNPDNSYQAIVTGTQKAGVRIIHNGITYFEFGTGKYSTQAYSNRNVLWYSASLGVVIFKCRYASLNDNIHADDLCITKISNLAQTDITTVNGTRYINLEFVDTAKVYSFGASQSDFGSRYDASTRVFTQGEYCTVYSPALKLLQPLYLLNSIGESFACNGVALINNKVYEYTQSYANKKLFDFDVNNSYVRGDIAIDISDVIDYVNNIDDFRVLSVTVVNNTLNVKIYKHFSNLGYYVLIDCIYQYPVTSFFISEENFSTDEGVMDLTNINSMLCFDVMDINTGELLVDHNLHVVTVVPDESNVSVGLGIDKRLVGNCYFYCFDKIKDISHNLTTTELEQAYIQGNIPQAFFPLLRYLKTGNSVYMDIDNFGYQGIAVFDNSTYRIAGLSNKYMVTMLSPLCKYIIPPRVKDDKLYVYAGKTYTHHIKWSPDVRDYMTTHEVTISFPTMWTNIYYDDVFMNDNSTDISRITVAPRTGLITSNSVELESNNKYYITDKTLIEPNSISFYDNKVHVVYKAAAGNAVIIDGSSMDLGTSDMSIKQEADLMPVYLLKYTDQNDTYNFVMGEYDGILNADTKEIINTIADKKRHWVTAKITGIDYTQSSPQVTLQFKEYHDNDSNLDNNNSLSPLYTRTVTLDSELSLSDAFINKQYSDDTQLVINSNVAGNTNILLPSLPTHNTNHSIAGDEIRVYDSNLVGTYFKYQFTKGIVSEMHIREKNIARPTVQLTSVESGQYFDEYKLKVDQSLNTFVYFKHYGIYKIESLTTGSITPKIKELTYTPNNGRDRRYEITLKVSDLAMRSGAETTAVGTDALFNIDLKHFNDATECTPKYLDYSATDVRDDNESTKTKQFARVMADSEYQLVKQHWDSTNATENFWWIDSEHTMKLTKDRFIVEEKLSELDPWNGNKWQKIHEYERTDYLTSESDTCVYSSSSGKNAHCYLYVLSAETTTSIRVKVYDPLVSTEVIKDGRVVERMNLDCEMLLQFYHYMPAHGNSGANLSACTYYDVNARQFRLASYTDILSSTVLSDSKLSAVEINGTHYLGIQYDKNLNQWTIAYSQNSKRIIHGYGCVGINGYATGGMIPADYFVNGKINFTLESISALEAEEGETLSDLNRFNLFRKRVVGDENQQWYITEELKDIVMAVSLEDTSKVIKLPITNKYAQIYSSPSYAKYTVHALGIQIKQLVNLFGDDENPIWKEIIKYAMFPLVWYLSPYTNVINYLQQTLGQYAYVHYNSTSIGKQGSKEHSQVDDDNAGLSENEAANHIDALVTDDLSFDVQHIPQEQSFRDNAWDNILGIFASMVVSATDYAMKDITVNSLQNQSAVSDIGRKFSQAFLQNIGSMSVTGFNMQSTKPMLKSEVTAVKTLDMFYSTSAQQNCYAGPGYVNMQFVAQCTAQSVTSVQLEAQQTQMFMLLKQLTTWQGKATMFVLDLLKDFMFKMADVMGGGPSAGVVVGLGWIGATVTAGVGYALVAAKALVKLGLETVDSMLDSFFPNGINSNVTAQLSRHNYDIEGKHAYGNKSECFMWPCADARSKDYVDETVEAVLQDKSWPLEMPKATTGNIQFKPIYSNQPDNVTIVPSLLENEDWEGKVPYSIAMCKGAQKHRALPDSIAFVIGTESFMPTVPFKNENIGEGEPMFTPPPVQDYIIDKNWNLFVTAMAGDALWVSCKDTKLFDGNYSNIVVTDSFCGIAAPHVAVEIKRDISEEYLRPWAVSPDAIALNITGLNCAYEEVAYHAFDGYGYRITDWLGSSGMNKEHYTLQYCFQVNDRFKRSNKLPPNQFLGNFQAVPSMSLDVKDKVFNDIQVTTEERGMRTGVAGENKDTQRYSLPIFTEQISSLPAIVRALSPYKLAVVDGITSLTTDVRSSQSAYKIPDSVDFNINDKLYRMTNEYICSVDHEKGLEVVKYLVPALGLTYLGATPFMAYFYNQATRQYYIYQGGNTLQVMDMLERFRDIKSGTYDFINQEVVMPCLATMTRLDKNVKDDADETDNIVIPVFRHNKVGGELTPPTDVIFNTDSWYRTVSIPAGITFQGPNRCIINRFVWSQYMLKDIKDNKGKWIKVPREEYHPFRKYGKKFNSIAERVHEPGVVRGWTHNPFLLVTSPLGVQEEVDCKFEWEITFAWTVEMEQLYADNEYVTVNVMAETMTPGGKVFNRPTHIFLHKELFTRSGNFGYYSFRYQGNNGIGNRERLHIWSDGYIAISSLQLEYKIMTEKRNEVLVIQEDLKGMKEM